MADIEPVRPVSVGREDFRWRRNHPLAVRVRGVAAGLFVQVVGIVGAIIVARGGVDPVVGIPVIVATAATGWLILVGPAERAEVGVWCRGVGHRALAWFGGSR